ncbi:MAG: sensor histidine kinase [Fibrobacterota bacterium]
MNFPDWLRILLAIVSAVVITYLDTHMPLGYGIWVLYLIPILIVASTGKDSYLYLCTISLAGLMAVDIIYSRGPLTKMILTNRLSSYVVFWVVTIVLAGRNQALKQSQEHEQRLISVNRDIESFSYSVSHDLRGPLNTISNLAEVLQQNYSDSLDSQGRECVIRIKDGIKKMGLLIEDILSLSRIGTMEINRSKTNMSEIVREVFGELQQADPQRKVEIVIQDDVYASADSRLISRAIQNLICNSWKFTSRKSTARIEFGTFYQAGKTVFFIRDNGVGFAPEQVQSIFKPFRRIEAHRDYAGTGIGLSIVDRVISRHGGKVWAEGQEQKGATFYFTLG